MTFIQHMSLVPCICLVHSMSQKTARNIGFLITACQSVMIVFEALYV